MLNITFLGKPYLFTQKSLDVSGAITTPEAFRQGLASFAHYYADTQMVIRFGDIIGSRSDIEVMGQAEEPALTVGEVVEALTNMVSDESWNRR